MRTNYFLVLTVKKWLKSVYIYGSCRKIKTGVSLFGPLCRMLYWSDWSSTSPAICRSSVDNTAREILLHGDLYRPFALTIDFTGN